MSYDTDPSTDSQANESALVAAPWGEILKKNLVFQQELLDLQRSQSKFAARYYDMDTYWDVFFAGRTVDPSIDEGDLAKLRELRRLNCGGTAISDLDVLVELQLPNLESIDCSRTGISDLRGLAHFPGLSILTIEYTAVADLSPLRELVGFRKLYISHTPVIDVEPLAGMAQLVSLDLNSTGVSDLSPISGAVQLESVVMNACRDVRDLSPLRGKPDLFKVDVSGTGIETLDDLADSTSLRVLVAGDLDIDSIDVVAHLPQIESLYVSNARRPIDLTPLADRQALQALYIGGSTVRGEEALLGIPSLTMLFHDSLSPAFCAELARANPNCQIIRH